MIHPFHSPKARSRRRATPTPEGLEARSLLATLSVSSLNPSPGVIGKVMAGGREDSGSRPISNSNLGTPNAVTLAEVQVDQPSTNLATAIATFVYAPQRVAFSLSGTIVATNLSTETQFSTTGSVSGGGFGVITFDVLPSEGESPGQRVPIRVESIAIQSTADDLGVNASHRVTYIRDNPFQETLSEGVVEPGQPIERQATFDAIIGETISIGLEGRANIGINSSGVLSVAGSLTILGPATGNPVGSIPVGSISATPGTPLNNVLVATFNISEPTATPANFSAQVNLGNGTAPIAGTITQPGGPGRPFEVRVSPTYANAGTFTITTTFTPTGIDVPAPDPVSTTVTVSGTPTGVAGPQVNRVQRRGFHLARTTLVLGFDSALDPASAQNVNNYRLVGRNGRSIRIDSATYDAASNTVVLRPRQRLMLFSRYGLTVVGTGTDGIRGTNGIPLGATGTGGTGSDFNTVVTRDNLVIDDSRGGGGQTSNLSRSKVGLRS